MTRVPWRLSLVLSACVVLGQLFRLSPLVDVVADSAATSVDLRYPAAHVVLAPFTLLADWLNGSPARELKGFAWWTMAVYVAVRLARWRHGPVTAWARARRESLHAALAAVALAAFVGWGARVPRPIPRLVAEGPDAVVFDVHSHTAVSHDGRRGFDASTNAAWHARAGFDAAFVTDHNTTASIAAWLAGAPHDAPPRLLPGVELSLSGLHLLALGSATNVPNEPYRGRWEATGRLVRALAVGRSPEVGGGAAVALAEVATRPYLIASLPEYWRYHWGDDLDTLTHWGVEGFEVWTSSPRAMDFPSGRRREVIARCRRDGCAMFGATDMHGWGYTASVWNVARLPGWKAQDVETLGPALVALFRGEGAAAHQVVARRRWLPETAAGIAVAVPVNLAVVLRTVTPAHALALLAWIWLAAVLTVLRRPAPRS